MKVEIERPVTTFGEMNVAQSQAVVQIDAVNGMRSQTDVETFTDTGGSVSVVNTGTGHEFKCATGTSVGGYGLIRSRRPLRYRPGQGQVFRWTARYPGSAALGAVRSGAIGVGTELSFGYDGTNFGILHRSGGYLEVQTLTLSAGAGGAETATVTLNGASQNVALTSGTAAFNAYQLAAQSYTGWNAYQNGSTVVFVATAIGAKTNAFTFSSTGTAAGTFAETIAGVAVTDRWVYQERWNIDPLDGSGPSGMVLDVAKGNVYEIAVQFLGYGEITFRVENPKDGKFIDVHRIQYANANTSPSMTMPSLRVGWFAASLGSTTDLQIFGASAAGIIQGPTHYFRNPRAVSASKSGIGTSSTAVLSIRSRAIFGLNINLLEIFPQLIAAAVDGTKPAVVEVWLNPTLGGTPNWTYIDATNSMVEYDTAATTVTAGNGYLVSSAALDKVGGTTLMYEDEMVHIERGDVLTIAIKASSGTTDATVSCQWLED